MRKIIALLTALLLALSAAALADEMPTTPPDIALADVTPTPEPPPPANPSILMSDPQRATAMAVGGLFTASATVLGGDIPRDTITEIRFESSLENVPAGSWDVSAEQNGSVQAWVQGGLLVIAGQGGVWANEDSTSLFAGYSALTSIDFNNSFHTELAANLSHMFEGDWSLAALDTSTLMTPHATDLSYMFNSCASLKELDASGLYTGNATSMEGMFLLDASLESLDLSGFEDRNAESLASMFEGCAALKSVTLSGFRFEEGKNLRRMFADCAALENLNVGAGFPTDSETDGMFDNCPAKLVARGVEMSAADWANLGSYANLKRKSSGDAVRWLQTKLLAQGYAIDTVDGAFGAITEEALKAWQTANGFEPTGVTSADQVLLLLAQ